MPLSTKNLLGRKLFGQYEPVDASALGPNSSSFGAESPPAKTTTKKKPSAGASNSTNSNAQVSQSSNGTAAPIHTPPPQYSLLDSPIPAASTSITIPTASQAQPCYSPPDLISLDEPPIVEYQPQPLSQPQQQRHHQQTKEKTKHKKHQQHPQQQAALPELCPLDTPQEPAADPSEQQQEGKEEQQKVKKEKKSKRWVPQRRKRNTIIPAADKGVTDELWNNMRSESGQLRSMMELLRVVQVGGVQRHLRPEVWPLLLGCFAPEDDYELQAKKLAQVEEEFSRLLALAQLRGAAKQHFESQGATEEWETTQRRIFTDATRVGLDGPLLQGSSREASVHRLERILLAYALMDPATGYCQGMADIAAPFIHLYARDHKAYWAFTALMGQIRSNFAEGLLAIKQQMSQLKGVMAKVDPPLFKHLERLGAQEFELAFQMFLVLFRRELPWEDTFRFWEMLWACEALAQEPLKVHCAAALFEAHRRTLLEFDSCDELVQFVNGIPGEIDVAQLVRDAFSIWRHVGDGHGGGACGCVGFSGSKELKFD